MADNIKTGSLAFAHIALKKNTMKERNDILNNLGNACFKRKYTEQPIPKISNKKQKKHKKSERPVSKPGNKIRSTKSKDIKSANTYPYSKKIKKPTKNVQVNKLEVKPLSGEDGKLDIKRKLSDSPLNLFIEQVEPDNQFELWTNKYSNNFSGNPIHVNKLSHWISKKLGNLVPTIGFLLSGPSGIGKSLLVNICTKKLKLQTIVFGPGDLNTQNAIENELKPALFNVRFSPVVVVVDGIEHMQKMSELLKIFKRLHGSKTDRTNKKTKYPLKSNPLILITDKQYDVKLNILNKFCSGLVLHTVKNDVLKTIATNIIRCEQIELPEKLLLEIINASDGNVRYMINQLQAIHQQFEDKGTITNISKFQTYNELETLRSALSVIKYRIESQNIKDTIRRAYDKYGSNFVWSSQYNFPSTNLSLESSSEIHDLFCDIEELPEEYHSSVMQEIWDRVRKKKPIPHKIDVTTKTTTNRSSTSRLLTLSSIIRNETRFATLETLSLIRMNPSYRYCSNGDSFLFRRPYMQKISGFGTDYFSYAEYNDLSFDDVRKMNTSSFDTMERLE